MTVASSTGFVISTIQISQLNKKETPVVENMFNSSYDATLVAIETRITYRKTGMVTVKRLALGRGPVAISAMVIDE
jgi:hypothetical protein